MINTLRFELINIADLSKELAAPVESISVGMDAYRRVNSVTLWRTDKSGIRIDSIMKDITEQFELPVLRLELRMNDLAKGGLEIRLGHKPTTILAVYQLIIEDEGHSAEAGLLLVGNPGLCVTILPSSFPYSLTISGLPGYDGVCDSQWPLEAFEIRQIV